MMNLLPLLLGFILLGNFNKQNKKYNFDLLQILSNPDLAGLLPHVAKLIDKNSTEEDKNFAMMNLLTNPAIFEIMQKFTSKQEQPDHDKTDENNKQKDNDYNQKQDENKQEQPQTEQPFSAESQEFFAPIKDVADKQISQKLYALYDNWYVKK